MEDKSQENLDKILTDFVQGYTNVVTNGFDSRWRQVKQEIYDKHISETIGALMSRQATLSIEMANAPTTWNGHVAPLFLRCMVDAYITFAWILESSNERSLKYIEYGLGQEKLFIEFLEDALAEDPDTYDAELLNEMIEVRKNWLNSQLADWATEVNVGSWSGMSAREMAQEIGRESIYKHAYVPFSGAAHNMWQHIGIYNTEPCSNPLHKWHVVPKILTSPIHPDFMYRSAKYISITYELFDEKMGIECEVQLPVAFFLEHELFSTDEAEGG
ncbi:MAG: hypothetical protein KZQ75_10410 [Candidatus Thiodiazotropha sp. (ex Myrtea spinifera)]|nr:hypothetical protein [Candidatus Thiodiazotropha sp. (ex Myrtea spinifera)]